MKTFKEMLESNKETKNNPLVVSYEDPNGKVMIGQINLNTAVELYGLNPKKILDDPRFWRREIIKSDGKWSTAKKGVYIQISRHSNFL